MIRALTLLILVHLSLTANCQVRLIKEYTKGRHQPVCAVYTPDGEFLLTGGLDSKILIRDVKSGLVYKELTDLKAFPLALTVSENQKMVVAGGKDKKVTIWNLDAATVTRVLEAHKADVTSVDISTDNTIIASGSKDKTIIIWDVANGYPKFTLTGHTKEVYAVAFNNAGTKLISGSADGTIMEWEVASGRLLRTIKAHDGWVRAVAYSGDDELVATGGDDKKIKLWDAVSMTTSKTFDTHTNWIQTVVFSSDNKVLASGGHDKTIVLTDVSSGRVLFRSDSQGNTVMSIAFRPNGKDLASVSLMSDHVRVWDITELKIQPHSKADYAETVVIKQQTPIQQNVPQMVATENSTKVSVKFHAVLIAVEEYQDPNIAQLSEPVKDAEKLEVVLNTKYTFEKENIKFVRNPTFEELNVVFEELSQTIGPSDMLLIFYAGHGFYDEKTNIGYWLPIDAAEKNRAKWFRNSALVENIGAINSRHTLLVADACFSGGIFKTRAPFNNASTDIANMMRRPSRKAMTSGSLTTVPDKSVFMKYFLKTLEENPNKYLTSEDLFDEVRLAMKSNATTKPQYGEIHGVGDEGGNFVLVRREE